MHLDPFTLLFTATVASALAGAQLLWAWRANREVPALFGWGVAYLMAAVASTLLGFRGHIPDLLSIDAANALFLLAFGLCLAAARDFGGRQTSWPVVFGGTAIWLVACRVPAIYESFNARVFVGSMILAVYAWAISVELLRLPVALRSARMAATVIAAHGLFIFMRGVASATIGAAPPPDFGFPYAVTMIESVVFIISTTFLVINLAKERMELVHKAAALVDPLTGVANRRGFFAQAEQIFGRGGSAPVAVVLFDLDRFKQINDNYGHAVGDRILQIFAEAARSAVDKDDVLARIGGEEFAMVLRAGFGRANIVADTVVSDFARAAEVVAGLAVAATVSAGLAISSNGALSVEEPMIRADRALYRAKNLGRNRVEAAPPVQRVPREAA